MIDELYTVYCMYSRGPLGLYVMCHPFIAMEIQGIEELKR